MILNRHGNHKINFISMNKLKAKKIHGINACAVISVLYPLDIPSIKKAKEN